MQILHIQKLSTVHNIHQQPNVHLINPYKARTNNSSAWRQKGLTAYCLKYIDRPFCLQTDELQFIDLIQSSD